MYKVTIEVVNEQFLTFPKKMVLQKKPDKISNKTIRNY